MPPTFGYIVALMIYVAAACAVWGVAVVLAIPRRIRTLAKRIAAGMAGSFPGVFFFQLLSTPLAALVLLTVGDIFHFFRPPDIVIVLLFPIILSIPTVASLLGFYTGWRVAWEWASDRSVHTFLEADRMLGPCVRFVRKRLPFFARVLLRYPAA
jgi:hypothetical protein